MFDIQGTVSEKAEIQNLLNILQETKIGAMLIKRIEDLLNGRSSIVLKFDRALSMKGLCEFKQVTLNPRLLTTQNECVSTLGHELAHAVMWDIQKLALNNTSSLDEYALVKLLSEAHGHMVGDLILQELNPHRKDEINKKHWYDSMDLTKKENRTLYLKKALMLETGWAEYELEKLNKSHKFSDRPNTDIFKENCTHFLQEMDTDVILADVLKTMPYSHFIQRSSNLWKRCKKFLGR